MTEEQALALRESLLAHRARLLEHADQQVDVDVDPHSLGWLNLLPDM